MTIRDIARLAGVSTAAVSRYFNNGYVSEEKREAIRRAVEATGYRPSLQAQTLRTRRTKLVGVVIPRIDSSSISRIVTGILGVTEQNGYQILLADTLNDNLKELEYLSLFREKRVDGLILAGTHFTEEHIRVMKQSEVPVVIVGQKLDGFCCVHHDDYHAERDMTAMLLHKGCRKPVYIGVTPEDVAVGQMRLAGFQDAVREAGQPHLAERFTLADFHMESGYAAMEKLAARYPDLDAVIAATDTIASGAMRYLRETGKRIPEDVMAAGQGDSVLSRVTWPELTTIRYYYEESGRKAAGMLLEILRGERDRAEALHIRLGYELLDRGTTKRRST